MIEIALFTYVLATLFSLARIFESFQFAPRLVATAVMATVLVTLMRRRGLGMAATMVVHLIVGAAVITVMFDPGNPTLGMPSLSAIRAIYDMVATDLGAVRTAVPPLAESDGLIAFCATAIWLLVLFIDSAAFRAKAYVQAVIPLVVIFVALGIPDFSGDQRPYFIAFGLATGAYAVTIQSKRDSSIRWVGTHTNPRYSANRLSIVAAIVVSGSVLATVLALGVIPSSQPLVNLKHRKSNSGREVTTPFVSIRSLLGERSNTVMFTVATERPSYWRLTALDTYDESRDIWVSSGRYTDTGADLQRSTAPSVQTDRQTQSVTIAGLGGPWVPAAYEPSRYEGSPKVTFNAATSTLFAADDLATDDEYEVTSMIPAFSPRALSRSQQDHFAADDPMLQTPPVTRIEESILAALRTQRSDPYSALLGLQEFFRTEFTYSEDVNYSSEAAPVEAFLYAREGFCQQFSSVFALLARRMGLASRVGVGFTMGDEQPAADTSDEASTYVVRGMHAHAWPEVYFRGAGWVAFEPTPGRGNPATASFTGVEAAQATTDEPAVTSALPTTDAVAATPSTDPTQNPPTTDDRSGSSRGEDPSKDRSDGAGSPSLVLSALALLALSTILGTVIFQRRRRKLPRPTPDPTTAAGSVIEESWGGIVERIQALGCVSQPSDTPLEFTQRAVATIDKQFGRSDVVSELGEALTAVAWIETTRRYSELFESPGPTNASVNELVERTAQLVARVDQLVDALVEGASSVTAVAVGDVLQ